MLMLQRNTAIGSDWLTRVLFVLTALALAGCATTYQMMPTPLLYTGVQAKPLFTDIPAERRAPSLDLLYITDRAPATGADNGQPYTAERSRSLAFGSTTVQFGENVSWDTLVEQSLAENRKAELDLTLGPTKELGRFPRFVYELNVTPAGLTRSPAVIAAHEKAKKEFQAEVARRLAISPRKEVVLFVHGYANTFEDAAFTMGELCHFLGREFVCAIFAWPAGGSKGALFGYQVDVESGVFAQEDLKKTIRMIATTPGLERIHLLAHSRGTDILASAMAELQIEGYVSQTPAAQRLKIGNVVLLAPDIDIDVAPTKIWKIVSDPDLTYGKEPNPAAVVPPAPAFHMTVYVSPDDKALAASGWLFGSVSRLGRVQESMMSPEDIAFARRVALFDVIQVNAVNCFICHSYFVSNPRVSADLIAMIRYGLKPNDPGRSLIEVAKPFYRVPTDDEAGAAK